MKRYLLILLAAVFVFSACSKKETKQTEAGSEYQQQMELGEQYFNARKFDEAIEAYLKCIEMDEKNVDAYIKLSEVYVEQKNYEEAAAILEQGYESTEDESLIAKAAEIYTDLGKRYYKDEDYSSAIEAFEKAIAVDPTYVNAYMQLSDLYYYLEEYDNADAVLAEGCEMTESEELIEKRFVSLTSLGERFLAEEDYESAIPCLESIIEAGRGDDNTRLSLGTAYLEMDDFESAIAIFEGLENQEDENVKNRLADAYSRYGEQCYDGGDNEKAMSYLKRAIELAPNQIGAYGTLISVYMDTNQLAEAGKLVDSSVGTFMNAEYADQERFESYLGAVSNYYADKDDVDTCLRFWEKATALKPDNEDFKEMLDGYRTSAADETFVKGEELLEKGDAAGAAAYFKRSAALAPLGFQEGFVYTDYGAYYLNSDGSYKLGWYKPSEGDIYYFNPAPGKNYACSGMEWVQVDGSYYYFMDDGRMLFDDTTPDGYYVGLDGKRTGTAPTEAETEVEEETDAETGEEDGEDETETPETKPAETKPAATKPAETKPAETKPSSGASTSTSGKNGKLKLNTEILKEAKESGGVYAIKKEDLFMGLDSGNLTLNDVYTCMNQYGMKVEWILEESTYELGMGDMVVWVFPGGSLAESGVVVKDPSKYRESLREKNLPDGTTFAIQFDAKATGTNEAVDISKMESINNK